LAINSPSADASTLW